MLFEQKSLRKSNVEILTMRPFGGRRDFLHEVQFSAAIGAAHFPADLRNAALSAFEEGAPFMGTALAEYKQCIGPRLSAFSPSFENSIILKFLIKQSGSGRSFLALPFFFLQRRTFSLLKKTAHSRMGAIGKSHADGKARFHECLVLVNSIGDNVPVFFESFFLIMN